jgi:8-oxo-dGTP diphosphatase
MHLELDLRPVLKSGGKSLMGEGRAKLLRQIKATGSLSKAAAQMGMSYRHAWGTVHRMEELCGQKIVQSVRGGAERGQSMLTEAGETLLSEFDSRIKALDEARGRSYRKSSLTTDGILVKSGKILLIRRKNEPFKGSYALPGGFVEYGETVEHCVTREFYEETGLKTGIDQLLGVYSEPGRDPRGHTVSVVFVLSHEGGNLSDSDETHVEWFPLDGMPKFAFDHEKIVSDYLKSRKRKAPISSKR